MSRKKHGIPVPLDPEKVETSNAQHKQNLLLMGYMPYQDADGKITWLNSEQHSYKLLRSMKERPLLSLFTRSRIKGYTRQHKHRPMIIKFLKANFWFMFLLTCVAITIYIILSYEHLIFY